MACTHLAPHYLIDVSRPARTDEMTVMVERREGASDADGAAAAARLATRVKDTIGVSIAVDLKPPGFLDRSQGKAKRVIDRRPRN